MENSDQTTTSTEGQKNSKMYTYIVGIVLVVFVVLAATLLKGTPKNPSSSTTTQVTAPTTVPNKGTLSLSASDGSARYATNATVTLNLTADSVGEDVVTFGVVLTYDKDAFTFVGAKSQVTGFSVYPKDQEGAVAIVGVKAPSVKDTTVLTQTPLVQVTFRAKKAGNYTFSPVQTHALGNTRFVTDKLTFLYPSLSATSVEIF